MSINFNNLPVGKLPYDSIQLCKQMMLRLYENVPFLPELPLIDPNDDIYHRTIGTLPCLQFKEGKILIAESNNEKLMQLTLHLEKVFQSGSEFNLDDFAIDAPFMEMYTEILKRIKPKTTVVSLVGPFTLSNSMMNKNAASILLDKNYRKFLCSLITVKALWLMKLIKSASPETKPIIIFDEKMLFKYGTLKRANENITKETVTTLWAKIFNKLRKEGAIIGVQSFDKCNWQLVFDSECVDIISFDAYNNPANLNILAPSVNKFLVKGGYINWGFVPVMNENAIRSLNITMLQDRLHSTMEALANEGVSMDLLLKKSTVSIQGDLHKQPLIFAEKALMMASQLASKLPAKK